MESSLSLAPQAISLITCSPVFSPLSSRAVGLLRSEFIGNGRYLRLPRRRCRKLWPKSESSYGKFLFRASLDSQSIAVVAAAVATVSAAAVVYLAYKRKHLGINQMSGRLTLALSEQIRIITRWILTDAKHLSSGKKESTYINQYSMKETRENNGADISFGEANVIPGGSLVVEAPEEFKLSIIAPAVNGCLTSLASEALEISSSVPSVVSESDFPAFVDEVCEVQQNAHELSHSVAYDLSVPITQTNLGGCASLADQMQEETDKVGGLNLTIVGEIGGNNLDHIFRSSPRRELHTVTGTFLEKLDNLEQLSSCATLQRFSCYSSLRNMGGGSDLTARNVVLPIEKLEEGRPTRYYDQVFLYKKDSRNQRGSRKTEKQISHTDGTKHMPPSFDPEQKRDSNKHNPSWQLRVYEQLLREGRLNECVELLEDMDGNGSFDMDKIYHSRFFDVCKRQKAVKVAFRFARLIRNPTLSTFNMLMSVCASSQDSEGAFQILQLVQEAALNADCKLYTTLISTCAKSGKVDTMFKVFHEMVNGGVEPNLHTYGALIDGCAKAGQVAKAFGAYGILRSKNVKPDRVVFNALITACGQSGAVDRAFDVLAEMRAELQPIDPDHVTVGALMKACASAGQIDRAREVYNMIHQYDIRGTAELYTIAVNSCSHRGDWEFACSVYDDMIQKGGAPDEMFISALIDVAGHAGKVDAAFEILQEARAKGMHVGIISYSSLMGACSKARDWQKALELYEDIKRSTLKPGVSLMNALITALCDADQLQKALEILSEMKSTGVCPNIITYSVLLVASEKKDDLEAGLKLFSQAKQDSVALNLVICRCLIAMCLRRFQADCSAGEPVLSFTSGHVQLNSKWTSLALMVYRETIVAGVAPRMDELSLVLGCLKLPHDTSVRNRLIENLGYNSGPSKGANVCSLINGFGEYDPRAFSLVEEATSLGVIPLTSMKDSLIVVDLRNFLVHTAAVYLLTVLKGLKHRLAAGVKAPNLNILLPVEKAQIQTSAGETEINMAGRVSQEVAALLRRLGLSYQGNGSYGKIRINGITIRKWFQPKLGSPFTEKKMELSSSLTNLASGINRQRRKIRTVHL
ncbi:pentatricopeptide repeat-containing protein MRL1, chloroplastic-like isoform X1 [Salvia splendens]|uniref:pentatricopeptide repeat-containing protein MRL1, chloroplastic-like isoform X1 n=1 Tax=Salvia splendens TaxID=180675 RepID=UPI001C270B26|nr:pentatricopeptide repeat-containing protein MRL1, chloroplastic-like isoform X1 [Salvia splendens]